VWGVPCRPPPPPPPHTHTHTRTHPYAHTPLRTHTHTHTHTQQHAHTRARARTHTHTCDACEGSWRRDQLCATSANVTLAMVSEGCQPNVLVNDWAQYRADYYIASLYWAMTMTTTVLSRASDPLCSPRGMPLHANPVWLNYRLRSGSAISSREATWRRCSRCSSSSSA
jgi:hypothetical protein